MRRRASEMLGLVAYLSVMYGRLPDRDLLAAAFFGAAEEQPEEPRLRLVVSNDEPAPVEQAVGEREAAAA